MSYYRVFNPSNEVLTQIKNKSKFINPSRILDKKIELCTYCMMDHSNENISNIIMQIRTLLSNIEYETIAMCYKNAIDRIEGDEDKKLWFCGYDYSYNEPQTDKNDTIEYSLSKLVKLICVVNTPDWFDDNEKFYEKEHEIESVIEYFCDMMTLNGDYEIIDLVKEYETKDSDYTQEYTEKEKIEEEFPLDGFSIDNASVSVGVGCSNDCCTTVTNDNKFVVYTTATISGE